MKDLPHHIKKLNRKVIRSIRREEGEEALMPEIPTQKPSIREIKKKAKQQMKSERQDRTPSDLTLDQRNKKMKQRVPIFDRTNNATPKHTRASKKKTPRI